MNFRRKPIRQRDIVSFGRRTPRFDFVALREQSAGNVVESERERPRGLSVSKPFVFSHRSDSESQMFIS